jgi:hypothetical protein
VEGIARYGKEAKGKKLYRFLYHFFTEGEEVVGLGTTRHDWAGLTWTGVVKYWSAETSDWGGVGGFMDWWMGKVTRIWSPSVRCMREEKIFTVS